MAEMKMSFYNELRKFIDFSDKQSTGNGIVGVREFNTEKISFYNGLKVEASVGVGRASRIPWISFLSKNDTVKNGIYPVYLYFKEKKILILAYGISESNTPDRSWNLQNVQTINEYFDENGLGEPTSYGGSFVYRAYDLKEVLVEEQVDKDINTLISIYKSISTNGHEKEAVKKTPQHQTNVTQILFDLNYFQEKTEEKGFVFSTQLIQRFVASLCTKPFVICSGLSGSGKTKLAQVFVEWICESDKQYKIIPVGADWTNREPLLGYPNSLLANHYVKPDSGVLDILLRAHADFQRNKEELVKCKPYFLILDEMNLSHVERYFADFLSTMESGDAIKLYSGSERYAELDNDQTPITSSLIPRSVKWPKNLFIVGTVNIDETTYMFSPKVLDRANTIEFRISSDEMKNYFGKSALVNMDLLLENVDSKRRRIASSAADFMRLAGREGVVIDHRIHQDTFVRFFIELQKAGAEFGYRTANEMTELMAFLAHFNVETDEAYDIAIMQKLLPKLHGSRSKLNKVIPPLLALCENDGKVIYPLSHEKLNRMKKNADENGFASYAEA
jgi:5-methylcytosine-specific restriction protein B